MKKVNKTELLDQRDKQSKAAFGQGLFNLLRRLEREGQDSPRIGKNTRLKEALVRLGQDPFLAFPDTDMARVDLDANPPMVRAQFLGFFGPQGALPLVWTEEVQRWFEDGDASFVAFTDIFAARFQELFFRAWSDARAITQYDHAAEDRFSTYLLSITGTGSPSYHTRDCVPDAAKQRLAPLAAGRVKSPVRLRQMLQVHFGDRVRIDIEEMVPAWLEFEPNALSQLGMQAATMGRDMHLGERLRSIGEKITIQIYVETYETYVRFLPGGPDHAHLRDLTFWYLGRAFDIEVALWLPKPEIQPAVLGQTIMMGWMACMAPDPENPEHLLRVTRFDLEPLHETQTQTRQAAA
ncbi:type VI secretion system baseplate subunit TssG [Sulfitobacter sp. F26204]|uniref:type VI secretion system baseplate subunit TssG n=1 Tax=Sulfitobacter sp. F26204 TaxID=2996014 RepID=UPI00225E0FF0|nr:type VI secretion system baseplate subunit TssG [Sulfitobacter sp. F26204]MCX7561636.1 type VI secretion system baseplate subunit TssG [Sulfitobacter sp. F26204]